MSAEEKKKQLNGEHYRLLLDSLDDPIIVINRDYIITDVNEPMLQQTGYRREEVIGQPCYTISHGLDKPCWQYEGHPCPVKEVWETGRPNRAVHTHIGKQGIDYVLVVASPIHDAQGRVSGVIEANRNLSREAQQTRQALYESETRFRSLVESMDDIVYTLDRQQRHTGVYGSWVERDGLTPDFFIGKTPREILGPELAAVHEKANARALQGEYVIYDWEMPAEDGRRYFQTSLSPLRSEQGAITGLVGIGRDITDQRRREISFRKSEAHFRNTLETVNLVALTLDIEGRVTFANDFLLDLTGWTAAEVMGRDWFEQFIPAEIIDEIRATFTKTVQYGQLPVYHENEIMTRTGERRYIAWSNTVQTDDRGAVISVTSLGQDITDRRHIEEALYFIAQRAWSYDGGFFQKLVQYLGEELSVDYAFVGELAGEGDVIETLALYAGGQPGKNFSYPLKDTPCENVVGKELCRYPDNVQNLFPKDELLVQMGVEGYAGIPLWNSQGRPSGIIVVLSRTPLRQLPLVETYLQIFAVRAAHELERQQVEKLLRRERDLAENLIDTAPAMVVVSDARGRVTRINQFVEQISDYTAAEIIGQPFEMFLPEIEQERLHHEFARIVVGDSIQQAVHTFITKEGRRLQIEWNGVPFKNEAGEFIGVLAIGLDITERLRSEANQSLIFEIGRKLTAVQDLDTLTTNIVQLIHDTFNFHHVALFTIEEDRLSLQASAGAYTAYFPADHTQSLDQGINGWVASNGQKIVANDIEQEPRYISLIPERSQTRAELCLPLQIGSHTIGVLDLQSQQKNSFDSLTVMAMETLADQVAIAIENAHLLKNLRSQVKMLQNTQARLVQSEKLAAIGELVAGVAHELNNPLAAVVLYAQLLQQKGSGQAFQADLNKIVTQAQRASGIVLNLLDFARQRPPERRLVQVNGVLSSTLELMSYELRTHNVSVTRRLAADIPMTMLDPHQLQQVFINLINNAMQAMQGSERQHLALKTEYGRSLYLQNEDQNQPVIRIIIEDSGPGISKDTLPRIFDPFYTTKAVGQGTGLGLSVCHGIISEHEGHIWAESQPGQGARFYIELPVTELPAQRPEGTSPLAEAGEEAALTRILVIDDEEAVQTVVRHILQEYGYEVQAVASGREALKTLAESSYQLILCDLRMPGMSGIDFYQLLMQEWPEYRSRIIFITGDTVNAHTRQFLEKEDISFLHKPFDLQELVQAVSSALAEESSGEGKNG